MNSKYMFIVSSDRYSRDILKAIAKTVSKVIGWIDAPLGSGSMMRGIQGSVSH
jgi:hypothetical protein